MSGRLTRPQVSAVLLKANRELAKILASSGSNGPASVVITDAAGKIEYVNKTFSELTGYEPSEAIGRMIPLLRSGDLTDRRFRTVLSHLRKGRKWIGQIDGRTKAGKPYWIQASVSPVFDKVGSVRHFLEMSVDITHLKQREAELKSTIDTLETHKRRLQATCDELASATRLLKKSKNKLARLSQEDALTGLLNRRGFNNALKRAKALAHRQGYPLGLLILDIDHFKTINDTYGHATGDHVLKACATILRFTLRASDLICRYGGDEFVIALPAADPDATILTAQRLLEAAQKYTFFQEAEKISLTFSIGAACCETLERGQSLESVLKMADRALYRIKKNGRNGMAYWSPANDDASAPEDPAQQ